MYTISLLNMKGGVGKTTISINLATGIAISGKQTLLVDLDPQSNTTSMFISDVPETNISALLKSEATAGETIIPVDTNLSVIPSDLRLANTETEIRMQSNLPQHNRLQKALLPVNTQYDYCVIDCPPIINLLTVNAIMASNLIIVPIKPDRFALKGFSVTMQNIVQIRENWELNLDYKILFTIVNRNNVEKEIISQLRNLDYVKAFDTEIRSQPRPIAYASANSIAIIKETDPKIGVAEDMRRFVVEVMKDVTNGKR